MNEYIERDAFREKLDFELARWIDSAHEHKEDKSGMVSMKEAIHELIIFPAADVAPVVHGEWIFPLPKPYNRHVKKCSVCGNTQMYGLLKYCPYCGAKMDGGKEHG